ncbi:ATP-binding cassette sub-family A member 17-like [Amblyomma americanum]
MPGELSGGMMRRLCVAISLLGKPKLLILDEPTTGLDPETRHKVWTAVRRAAKSTSVLVSTHSMAEAEAIADQIVVMAQGQVICSGSKAFLNRACGGGYKLTIVKTGKQFDLKGVLSTVRKAAPTADVEGETLDEVSIALRTQDHSNFPDVFEALEMSAAKLGIASMGVTAASLMDVYMKIIMDWAPGGKRQVGAVEEEQMTRICIPIQKEQTFLRSSRALFVKRFLCLRRSWGHLFLTFAAPIFSLLLIMMFIQSPMEEWHQKAVARAGGSYGEPDSNGSLTEIPLRLKEQFPGAPVFLQEPSSPSGNESRHFRVLLESDGSSARSVREVKAELGKAAANDFSRYMRTYPFAVAYDAGVVRGIYNPTSSAALPVLINLLHTAELRASTGHAEARIDTTVAVVEPPVDIRILFQNLVHEEVVYYWALVPALSYTLAFASFVVYPVAERLSGSRQMQLMTGIPGSVFILSHFLFDFVCYVVVMAAWCIVHFVFSSYPVSTAIYFYIAFLCLAPAAIFYAYVTAERAESAGGGIATIIQVVYVYGFIFSTVPGAYKRMTGRGGHAWFWMLFPPFGVLTCLAKISVFDVTAEYCKFLRDTDAKDSSKAGCDASSPFSFDGKGIGYELAYSLFQGAFFFAWASMLASGFILERSDAALATIEEPAPDQNVEDEKQLVNRLRENGQFAAHALVAWNLHKSYDAQHAVRGVYLALRPCECLGLLGVNGAGKTSTFQMLAGLSAVSYGEAYTPNGALTKNPREWQSHIGYCSQAEGLLDRMNAYEQLFLIGRLRGIPEADLKAIVDSVLSVVDVKEDATEKSAVYSGGTRRKLSTAMALLGLPPLILLDEPFTGVDAVSRSKIIRGIGVIKKNTQTSFVLTSHNMEECESACDRITIMVAGRMMCLGTLQQLKDKYGGGHRIEFALDEEDEDKRRVFTQEVTKRFPGIRLATVNEGVFTFRLAKRVPWSALFRKVVQLEKDFALSNAIVGDYGLEQIFISFANAAHHPERPVQALISPAAPIPPAAGEAGDKNNPKK